MKILKIYFRESADLNVFCFFVFLNEVEGHARNSTKQIDNLCGASTPLSLTTVIYMTIFA